MRSKKASGSVLLCILSWQMNCPRLPPGKNLRLT
jgi:hypothetical protein